MFSRSSASWASRWMYRFSRAAIAAFPAFAARFRAAIFLPRAPVAVGLSIPGSGRSVHPRAGHLVLQRQGEHLADVLDEVQVELAAQVLGDVVGVLLVQARRDDHADAVALRRQRLLLEPAD